MTNFFEMSVKTLNTNQTSTETLYAYNVEMKNIAEALENKEGKHKKNNKITTFSQPTFSGKEGVMEWIRITEKFF